MNLSSKQILSKLIMGLNIEGMCIKLLEKRLEKNLQDIRLGKEFLDLTPKVWYMKGKNNKLDLISP